MSAASAWRAFLIMVPLVSTACSDWALPRIRADAASDTTPDPPVNERPSADRGQRNGGRANAGIEVQSFAEVRRTLRRLAAAEATFFAENGTYTEDLPRIGIAPGKDVTIRFLWLSRDGWAASGTHTVLGGRDCVIFGGQARTRPTTLKYARRGREGVPVCDDSRRRPPVVSTAPPEPKQPQEFSDTGSVLDELSPSIVMKVDLRNLVRSQETYFANQGVYARRTQQLPLRYLWHPEVRIRILAANAESWAAEATHAKLPGQSCVIWFGEITERPVTDARRLRGNRSGEPVCDG
jgi:hypothetical protein